MAQRQKRESTQWTAQFLAAAELCRRGYIVSFTMGNCTQDYDLIVGTPNGEPFYVDVKGLSSNSDWLIKKKSDVPSLYYILVRIDKSAYGNDFFFIMKQEQVNSELEDYYREPKKDGSPKSANMQGFKFSQGSKYINNWNILPKPQY